MKLHSLLLASFGLTIASSQQVIAHSHHCCEKVVVVPSTTVVVEAPIVAVATAPAQIIVQQAPPADQTEVVSACPGTDYVWAKGHWTWNGCWVWEKGCWLARPHATAVWVPHQWVCGDHGWICVHGHWQ